MNHTHMGCREGAHPAPCGIESSSPRSVAKGGVDGVWPHEGRASLRAWLYLVIDSVEVSRGENIALRGTDPESNITEYTVVYEEKSESLCLIPWRERKPLRGMQAGKRDGVRPPTMVADNTEKKAIIHFFITDRNQHPKIATLRDRQVPIVVRVSWRLWSIVLDAFGDRVDPLPRMVHERTCTIVTGHVDIHLCQHVVA